MPKNFRFKNLLFPKSVVPLPPQTDRNYVLFRNRFAKLVALNLPQG
jgi:hypothetical protein